jgi:hypothetical protein
MNAGIAFAAGTRKYPAIPSRSAKCRYSTSSSTSVSECSETNATGTSTMPTPSREARSISAIVLGSIQRCGVARDL